MQTGTLVRWVVVAALLLTPAPAATQTAAQMEVMNSGRRTMTAERMREGERIVLDGVLDEPAWGRAEHGGEFVMQDPVLGGTPTERTEIRVVFNATISTSVPRSSTRSPTSSRATPASAMSS